MTLVASRHPSPFVRRLVPIGAAVAFVMVAPALQAQQLLTPDATVASFSQSYLSAKWWSWALLYPNGSNPVTDTSGVHSSLGDQGSYFFLAGALGSDPVTRTVTVRNDQVLFFPIFTVPSVIPYFGSTEAEIRADAADNVGTLASAAVTFDGAPAILPAGTSSLDDYRQQSPLFPLAFGANNIYGLPVSVLDTVSDGWWVAMAPLGDGAHTLQFTATAEGKGAYAGMTFSQDNTYHINVVPEAGSATMLGAGLALLLVLAGRRGHDAPSS